MDFSNIFRLVNLVVGGIMVLGGVSQFFPIGFQSIIVGIYVIIFGLAVAGLELLPQVPPYLPRYASFLFSFLGRGIFYVFVGCIILEGHVLRIIAGTIVAAVGVGYCALEFAPSIEPPSNMRDGDGRSSPKLSCSLETCLEILLLKDQYADTALLRTVAGWGAEQV